MKVDETQYVCCGASLAPSDGHRPDEKDSKIMLEDKIRQFFFVIEMNSYHNAVHADSKILNTSFQVIG